MSHNEYFDRTAWAEPWITESDDPTTPYLRQLDLEYWLDTLWRGIDFDDLTLCVLDVHDEFGCEALEEEIHVRMEQALLLIAAIEAAGIRCTRTF